LSWLRQQKQWKSQPGKNLQRESGLCSGAMALMSVKLLKALILM